ncbi:MAG: HEAT repeat domain-containing protein [Planctomycetes bacterium]|nr:HEAT repeat domain-containing protein [Planctomycetota bacterium]
MSRVEKLAELTSIREQALARDAARARLVELLDDDDAEVRAAAAGAVGSYPAAPELVRRVLGLARADGAPPVRREACLALGQVIREGDLLGGDAEDDEAPGPTLFDEARALLLERLGADDEDERLAVTEALGHLSHDADVVAAVERAAGGGRAARRAALRAMGESGDAARWRAEVLRALEASEADVVMAAAWAAGELGLREATPRLAALLGQVSAPGSDAAVARRAAEALGRTGGDDAARALEEAARSAPDEEVRQAAGDALEELDVLAGIDEEFATGGGA